MYYCVYILYSARLDRFYIGMTENLGKRLSFHNNPIDNSKFTSRGIPWDLYLSIPCRSKAIALKLERFIKKKKSRIYIEELKEHPELVEKILRAF